MDFGRAAGQVGPRPRPNQSTTSLACLVPGNAVGRPALGTRRDSRRDARIAIPALAALAALALLVPRLVIPPERALGGAPCTLGTMLCVCTVSFFSRTPRATRVTSRKGANGSCHATSSCIRAARPARYADHVACATRWRCRSTPSSNSLRSSAVSSSSSGTVVGRPSSPSAMYTT